MARLDHYLDCEDYQNRPASNYEGFTAFAIENDDHPHHFAMTDPEGAVLLTSEGYTSEAGRNNGIESVMRNRDIEERYVVRQGGAGDENHWYVCLLAGNKQEIARSCGFANESDAKDWVAVCLDYKTARKSAAAARNSNRNEDEYLPCEAYAGHAVSEKYDGFSTFQNAETSMYYFTMLDKKGRTMLISESYPTTGARDNGIESVIRNRDIEARYSVKQSEAGWYVSLKAGNHQEIAQSCPFATEAEAMGWISQTMAYNTEEKTRTSNAVIEDYLPCKNYEGHPRSEKYAGFTTFFHEETNQHYFAWVADDGKVILKSEGYPTTSPRDNGIESVIKNRDIEARWSEKQDEHGYYLSLKAGNHQEIGRSCHYQTAGGGWAWLPFAAAAVPVVVEPVKVEAPIVVVPPPPPPPEPVVVVPPPPPPKVVVTEKVAEPVVVPPVVPPAAASDGCMKYWWLLPLLLLLGLLWWLMKDGCNKPAVVAPPPSPKQETTVVETPKPAPVAQAPVCNCTGNQNPLFNIPTGVVPKSLKRLGTCPEFGNSHGLTPAQFLEKLQKKAASNKIDAEFLDGVFKGMGYVNGFKDAKVEQFSEVEVPAGTAGNMGYSTAHKTAYDRLDATGKDLLAFRIKAANGCDMHFMKTCGNHFFFCPNK